MKRSSRYREDAVVMLGIFVVVAVYVGIFIIERVTTTEYWEWGGQTHLTLALLTVIELAYFLFLRWKMLRWKTCKFTKIATWQYLAIIVLKFIYYSIPGLYDEWLTYLQLILLGGMCLMLFLYVFRLCYLKFGK